MTRPADTMASDSRWRKAPRMLRSLSLLRKKSRAVSALMPMPMAATMEMVFPGQGFGMHEAVEGFVADGAEGDEQDGGIQQGDEDRGLFIAVCIFLRWV